MCDRSKLEISTDQSGQWIVKKPKGDPIAYFRTEAEARAFVDGVEYVLEAGRFEIG